MQPTPLLSVNEAKAIISDQVKPLPEALLPLADAAGLVLAADIFAPASMPWFAQSAMDGYAFCFEDLEKTRVLPVTVEVAAGASMVPPLKRGAAARIFTGAPLPDGADTVVMQEKTTLLNGSVRIEDEGLQAGSNVRPVGAEIRKGDKALPAGTLLSPGAIGFAAGIGFTALPVFPPPVVSVLVTGNELARPGTELLHGQVYESNSVTLTAALSAMGVRRIRTSTVADSLEAVVHALDRALAASQLVLLTGGVSVGDFDFVVAAAAQRGVKKCFHKLAQKPGKPLFFGTRDAVPVFGLPGNPASVLTCFYEYVVPCLAKMMGRNEQGLHRRLPLSAPVEKKPGLTHFLKGIAAAGEVTPLGAQESFRMSSFARANCLVVIPSETERLEKGEMVEVHLLPD